MRHPFALTFAALVGLAGCGNPSGVECKQDEDCGLAPGGRCDEYASTGNSWCSYPDTSCPDGRRWSDFNTGDGISGECQASMIDAGGDGGGTSATLTVNVGGNGSGAVVSDPPGIDCASGQCSADFPVGEDVSLTATPTGAVFLGWSDACTGTGDCVVTLDQDAEVGALFGVPGEALWFDQIGDTTNSDKLIAIDVDAAGSVYVSGTFSGTVDVGGQSLTSVAAQEIYVAKLDGATGSAAWAVRFGAAGLTPGSLAVDSVGDVVIVGSFLGSVSFGGGTLTSVGSSDIFVAKLLGTDGSHVWSKRFGGPGIDDGNALAIDGAKDVVVGGGFKCANQPCTVQPTLTFGGSTFTNAGNYDLYVVKLAGVDGAHVWSKGLGAIGNDTVHGVAVDGSNDVVMTGGFSATVNFGGGDRVSAGLSDIFLVKYAAADGAHLFSQRYGSTGNDSGADLAIGGAGQIFFLGSFDGTVNFGGAQPLIASSASASVLAKYTLAGAHAWSETFTTTGAVLGSRVVAAGGSVTLVGSFCGTVTLGTDLSSASPCPDFDVLIAEFNDGTGAPVAAVRHGGTGSEIGFGVAQASDGRIFGGGNFSGFAEFGGEAYTSHGGTDGYVVGLAPLE